MHCCRSGWAVSHAQPWSHLRSTLRWMQERSELVIRFRFHRWKMPTWSNFREAPEQSTPIVARGMCIHNRRRNTCRECGGKSVCVHRWSPTKCMQYVQRRLIVFLQTLLWSDFLFLFFAYGYCVWLTADIFCFVFSFFIPFMQLIFVSPSFPFENNRNIYITNIDYIFRYQI